MKKIAYWEMYENEESHGWYIGTRYMLGEILKKKLPRDAKILDAGCGTGGTIKYLKSLGFKNIEGVDISPIAISLSKKRGLKNIKKSSVEKLPFKNISFDALICLDVLYHKGVEPKAALKEYSRVLKKCGLLYLQEPAYNWLRGEHDTVIETERRFSSKSLYSLAQKHGFNVKKITHLNTIFFLPILFHRLFREKQLKSDVQRLNPLLNKLLILALKTEAKLTTRVSLPFGLSIIVIASKK